MRLITETTEIDASDDLGHDLSSVGDADLLDAWIRDQEAAALAELVRRYRVMVLSVCHRRCRNNADADDAFQTTFLYLARNASKIRSADRLAGWLHRVAQRAAVASWKASQREAEPMIEPPAEPDDPLVRLTQRHEAIALDEELADLPDHYRSALVMHIYEGRPLQSLAEHFGTTIGSIRGRLQRGKQLLARKLRHRGVVPVFAFAAAGAWTVSPTAAARAGDLFLQTTAGGTLPDPPLDTSLLDSLLSQGVRLMPSIYTGTGLVGGVALLALILASGDASHGQSGGGSDTTVTLPATDTAAKSATPNFAAGNPAKGSTEPMQPAGGGGAGAVPASGLVWSHRLKIPQAETAIAERVEEALDQPADLNIHTSLADLAQVLTESTGIPVLLDRRGLAFAEATSQETIAFRASNVPLRSALRELLEPIGLQAVVEDEGLVITADPGLLVHRGIGTKRWINVDDSAAQQIASDLQGQGEVEFLEVPLVDAVSELSEQLGRPIFLEARALEEIGLTTDQPVTISASGIQWGHALNMMLSQLDLTYTIRDESLVITTLESEEENLLQRIYWLEGTGLAARDDADSIIKMITSSIVPDTWEELGGPSTIAPVNSARPALLITTTYQAHRNIDKLFDSLRETHFGVAPVMEPVQVPKPESEFGGGGGFF